jgi:hypothetical protein
VLRLGVADPELTGYVHTPRLSTMPAVEASVERPT